MGLTAKHDKITNVNKSHSYFLQKITELKESPRAAPQNIQERGLTRFVPGCYSRRVLQWGSSVQDSGRWESTSTLETGKSHLQEALTSRRLDF